ncbi:MAG TPA: LCP family protein [Anaerolineaceae bacterium]|jgi:LCP family protein required for cell wall assembly|nr:LCP family protein [Anaerolineales bacterium]HOG58885.1 LCP family protein [Anaerolineaceae bacterium]HOR83531.1 LCP family protein [Anaerolineaceae bacterium]HOT52781.1 LCP family protein [Anaerolineaceae bacterium]HPL42765.1 LCP family protein [Anaerolineaceae bacterium]
MIKLKRHQIITLIVFGALALTALMVVFSGALVSAAANSSAFPYRISFKDFSSTPTPFQPNAFANILEDGTIELLPQPIYTPTPVPVISRAQLPDNQLNILLLGCDDFSDNGFRTDVIMLLSLNPKHRSINLISFPRDLYVTIPGYWSNRINTAWGLGGFDLLADTFQANFGIHPDYYMMVNYNGFKDVVNSLDGIDVEVTQELQDSCKLDPSGWCIMEPGVVHMDGGTALWYSRSRLTTSDFDRNRRAQDVVKAIYRKAMNLNVVFKLPELYGAYREYVDTNLQLADILPYMSLASEVMKTQNINQYAVGPDTVTNWITAEGAMVLIPNYYAINPIIAEALYLND